MKTIRILSIILLSVLSAFSLSGVSHAQGQEITQPQITEASCETVTNPYRFYETQWWTYQQFINDYYGSCSTVPEKYASWSGNWGGFKNGAIPPTELTLVNDAFLLKDQAAIDFLRMDNAYHKETGKHLQVTDAYRPYNEQWTTWIKNPSLGAYPGTSGHGWGTSLDLATAGDYVDQGEWLKKNSEKYGWINPTWAHDGVSPEEPWHFDYKQSSHPKICTSVLANDCRVI